MSECRFCGCEIGDGVVTVDTQAGPAHESCVASDPHAESPSAGRRAAAIEAIAKVARSARLNRL